MSKDDDADIHNYDYWLRVYENFSVDKLAARLQDRRVGACVDTDGSYADWMDAPERIEALATVLARKRLGIER